MKAIWSCKSYVLLALTGFPWFCPFRAGASELTVCGVLDGSVGDANPAAGVVTTSCTFGATGSFSGTVTEDADPLNYTIGISGTFLGSASSLSFVTGSFSLSGMGDVYPFITFGGQLIGPSNVLADAADFFQLSAIATNFLGSSSNNATVMPMLPGEPLPQPVTESLGNLASGSFAGPGTLTAGIAFRAGAGATYSFATSGPRVLASTAPEHVIPEPSTLVLLTCGVVAMAVLQ
jgi:hypothetical protein